MPKGYSRRDRAYALLVGVACHLLFLAGVGTMMLGIFTGMSNGRGGLHGGLAAAADVFLIVQFPLFHSLLLSARGRAFIKRLSPASIAGDMTVTWFALFASLQLLSTFALWSPSGITLFEIHGSWKILVSIIYASSWLFLLMAMFDADISLQSGFKGWSAVVRNVKASYGDFPTSRTYRVCRQPIYLAFALILWTSPVWTLDQLLLASCWTLYCILGPLLKEARYRKRFGERFRAYQEAVPYFVPVSFQRLSSRALFPRNRGAASR